MATSTFFVLLVAASVVTGSLHGTVPEVPFETIDTIFEIEDRVKINSLSDPVPLYRKDLGADYVAYWQYVVNGEEQIIVSAGPKTADYKLVFQGPLPSMTTLLDHTASDSGQKCHRYYMLSPEVTLMCENLEGHLVATTRDSYIKHDVPINDTTLRYKFVEENYDVLLDEWKTRSAEVKEGGIWDEISLIDKEDVIGLKKQDQTDEKGFYVIRPGQTVKIPITGNDKIRLAVKGHEEHKLCNLLKLCTSDNHGVVDTTHPGKTPYGMAYVAMTVPEGTRGKDFRFDLQVMTPIGLVVKRFYLDLSRRQKRGATYSAWSVFSIGHEYLFPDYDQFKSGKCAVGCGPVAWAMIFGYFDRRSHLKTTTYGTRSQNLYRCGADGTTGAKACIAPKSNNAKTRKYIKTLKGILKTFCIKGEGATLQGNMDRVEAFFKARQTGRPDIISHKQFIIGFFGIYSSSIRSKGLSAIRSGWPIIPGIRVGGLFSQHYPVATKYRSRKKSEKKCILFICWTKTTIEYQMYAHMGWGGRQNGWRSANMFFVTYAKY